jgi:sulfite reductase (NADPH) hemoprotein beta-component
LRLGADIRGQRLNQIYRANVDETAIFEALEPLLARYAQERGVREDFGDFLHRTGVLLGDAVPA